MEVAGVWSQLSAAQREQLRARLNDKKQRSQTIRALTPTRPHARGVSVAPRVTMLMMPKNAQ